MSQLFDDASKGATFSPDRRYRYRLWRQWGAGHTLVVIGLNPSTADEDVDDPTIRRCIGFAKREGCGRLEMLNLFAFRSTQPELLYRVDDPVGSENDDTIAGVCLTASVVIAAWGAEKIAQDRAERVRKLLAEYGAPDLSCLGRTMAGSPRHPLYLRGDTPIEVL